MYARYVVHRLPDGERAHAALEAIATIAEIAANDDEDRGDAWTATTANDILAWQIIGAQLPSDEHGRPESSYWGTRATRHGWALAGAAVTAADVSRHKGPLTFEDLATRAALRGVALPRLSPGEEFEPPPEGFVQPGHSAMRFEQTSALRDMVQGLAE